MTPAEQMNLLEIAARRAQDGSARRIRKATNAPMRLLAERFGVTIATICRWEKGERRPSGTPGIRWAMWLEEKHLEQTARSRTAA